MKKYSCFLLLIVSFFSAHSQNTAITAERLYATVNTTTLISGETLLCKLYCLDAVNLGPSTISKIAYLDLIDSNKKTVSRQKLYLNNGNADGQIFIPTTLETGNYKLIAYTQWMLSESASNFFESDITLINPFTALKNGIGSALVPSTDHSKTVTHNPLVQLKTDKKNYANRDKVTLKIAAPVGNFTISVRKSDALKHKTVNPDDFVNSTTRQPNALTLNKLSLPELRGELISGKITSKSAASIQNKTVALTVKDKNFATKLVKTDASGRFIFVLDKDPISPDVVIQVMDNNRHDYQMVIDELILPNLSGLVFNTDLNISNADQQNIEQRSIAAQIENAYFNLKKDSLSAVTPTVPFYSPLEKTYFLNDYTRFPTIRETITEILQEVDYKKNRNGYSILIKNYGLQTDLYGSPLVLIDGYPIQDLNELFDFSAYEIHKVGIINTPYAYGSKMFSGIVSFTTLNLDFEPKTNSDYIKKTALLRPLQKKQPFSPDYANATQNARIPDYRQQLLWFPTATGPTDLSFFTSDVSGQFEIILEGFTADGTAVFQKESFEVK